ncbi:MAG: glycosyltransferase [Candidatus Rokuibacteriota bacterium]
MGAVHFSIDPALLDALTSALGLRVFVETGTHRGDGVETARRHFDAVYSIERSEIHHARAAARFADDRRVHVIRGDSPAALAALVPALPDAPTLFWLDAHWSPTDPDERGRGECPLLAELAAIERLGDTSAVAIDDARLFLGPPPEQYDAADWPGLDAVRDALRRLHPDHRLAVVNDCVLFFPETATAAVLAYARKHGVDWLALADKGREHDTLLGQLDAKDREIASLSKAAEERSRLLEEADARDRRLTALTARVDALEEQTRALARLTLRIRALEAHAESRGPRRWIRHWLAPRIGTLERHAPRVLRVPRRYRRRPRLVRTPVISIVTPSFNQGAFIERTMLSVLGQDYPALEYVVQDGGSSDGTVDILERYRDRLVHAESRRDRGQAHALNLGFRHATGEIMAYLNSDDILLPGALHYVAGYFNRRPDVDVVYSHRVLIDEDDREISRWVLPPDDRDVLSWADFIPQETLFWRRRIWERVGGYVDESFRFALDWDLLLRFRAAGATFVRLPRFLGGFRVHVNQKTLAEPDVGEREMHRLRERYLGRPVKQAEISRNVRRYQTRHIVYQKLYRAGLLRY